MLLIIFESAKLSEAIYYKWTSMEWKYEHQTKPSLSYKKIITQMDPKLKHKT